MRRPRGVQYANRRHPQRASALRGTEAISVASVITSGASPMVLSPMTTVPHSDVYRCVLRYRLFLVRHPVKVDTRVSKKKTILLGRIDHHAHSPSAAGVGVAKRNVLKHYSSWNLCKVAARASSFSLGVSNVSK